MDSLVAKKDTLKEDKEFLSKRFEIIKREIEKELEELKFKNRELLGYQKVKK